ncbi:hypothetical protein WN944_009070 [Citrus x changshan-huyou]|uniref:Uncharacterized protein n=1 Tax=Citrus x changshan-huyou TaxID=2935761 RepID=A0AAP0QDK0_9ROSI
MSLTMNSKKLEIQPQTLGPFFRVTAESLETENELGRAEGLIRVWLKGRVLLVDSIRLKRETLGMERSIFGIGLFIGAAAVRYRYDCGCKTAELLTINDSDLYHKARQVLQKNRGFNVVHEVTGSTMEDLAHMLEWGGIGTQMDANVKELLLIKLVLQNYSNGESRDYCLYIVVALLNFGRRNLPFASK